MSLLIKNWSLADWKELLKWAKIGANNAMIGEFAEVEEIPPHGDLIDRDALLDTATIHWSQTTNESCFPIDEIEYAPTVITASEEGET